MSSAQIPDRNYQIQSPQKVERVTIHGYRNQIAILGRRCRVRRCVGDLRQSRRCGQARAVAAGTRNRQSDRCGTQSPFGQDLEHRDPRRGYGQSRASHRNDRGDSRRIPTGPNPTGTNPTGPNPRATRSFGSQTYSAESSPSDCCSRRTNNRNDRPSTCRPGRPKADRAPEANGSSHRGSHVRFWSQH